MAKKAKGKSISKPLKTEKFSQTLPTPKPSDNGSKKSSKKEK